MSGVCRLSELLVSPGYKEEEEGGREREGGTLPPPVAIHYNCREWTGERHQDVTRESETRNCHEPKKASSCLCELTTQRMCVGTSLHKLNELKPQQMTAVIHTWTTPPVNMLFTTTYNQTGDFTERDTSLWKADIEGHHLGS